MKIIDYYRLCEPVKHNGTSYFFRQLMLGGNRFDTTACGIDICFQFSCGQIYLLGTSYDYFDGVSHWIYALNQHQKIIDQISLPDTFGFVGGTQIISESEIIINVHDEVSWRLTVLKDGEWCFSHNNGYTASIVFC